MNKYQKWVDQLQAASSQANIIVTNPINNGTKSHGSCSAISLNFAFGIVLQHTDTEI
jgi:hypothetical protein